MKKLFTICTLILTIFIILTSCNNSSDLSHYEKPIESASSLRVLDDTLTDNEVVDDNVLDDDLTDDEIIWQVDLNHDGKNEKIVVEILNNPDTVGESKISVYNGNSDLLIYSADVCLQHAGWNGLYLYYDENGAYLVNWLPTMYQGYGTYSYEVFSFDENGDKVVLDNGSLDFYSEDVRCEYKGLEDFVKYIQKVNSYLLKSSLIIDTNEGNLLYGTQDTQTINPFNPKWLFDLS